VDQHILLPDARLDGSLEIAECHIGDPERTAEQSDTVVFDASGATVGGRLSIHKSTLFGGVTMQFAQVGRTLSLTGSSLVHVSLALRADGIVVAGAAALDEGFTATGEVRLTGASIGGQLACAGGSFSNPDGTALIADGAQITGGAFLTEGFTASGEVRLLGASIGGPLACAGGTFSNPGGHALIADQARITGSAFLTEGFAATGEVRLLGASIGGQLIRTRSRAAFGSSRPSRSASARATATPGRPTPGGRRTPRSTPAAQPHQPPTGPPAS
jgi:hypothetical protein